MKKIAKVAMLASAFLIPNVANAVPADGTYVGQVTVSKGLTLNCNLTLEITDGFTRVSHAELDPTSVLYLLCSAVNFLYLPYPIQVVSYVNIFIIKDVYVQTITPGDCFGDVGVLWDPWNIDQIHFTGSIIPPFTSGGNCTIDGVLTKQ